MYNIKIIYYFQCIYYLNNFTIINDLCSSVLKATPTGAVTRGASVILPGQFQQRRVVASRGCVRRDVLRDCIEQTQLSCGRSLNWREWCERKSARLFPFTWRNTETSRRARTSQNPRCLIRTETAAERREPVGVFILSFVSFCELYWYVDACLPAVIDQSHFLSSVSLTEKCLKVPLLPATLILCSFLKNFGVCFFILSIWVYWSFTEMLRYDRKVYNDGKIYL